MYRFWVGSDAKVSPIYPWKPGHWDTRPDREEKRDRFDLPAAADKAWKIPTGSPGIKTLLLLVREESPLSHRDEEKLAKLWKPMPGCISSPGAATAGPAGRGERSFDSQPVDADRRLNVGPFRS